MTQGTWSGEYDDNNPPPGHQPGSLDLRQQLDYDGSTQTVDVGIYTMQLQCAFPNCPEIRYIKPQDAFHSRFCKPHSRGGGKRRKTTRETGVETQPQVGKATPIYSPRDRGSPPAPRSRAGQAEPVHNRRH